MKAIIISLSIIFIIGCDTSVEVDDDIREKLSIVNLNIPDQYIQPDTLITIVLRSKEDENKLFETYEIKSSLSFPKINYEQHDVIGISLGPRPNTATYVEIDSMILVNNIKIEVYTTEHWLFSLNAAMGNPLDMVTIEKYNVEIEFMEKNFTYE